MTGSTKEKHTTPDKNTPRVFTPNGIARFKDRLREAIGDESGNSFAKRCGMSEAVIRAYLSGKTYPSLDRLATLAEKCEVSIEWLANGGDTTNNSSFSKVDDCSRNDSLPVSESQQQAWLAFLDRMTPQEREAIIDGVFRQGIGALLAVVRAEPAARRMPWEDGADEADIRSYLNALPEARRQEILAQIKKGIEASRSQKVDDQKTG